MNSKLQLDIKKPCSENFRHFQKTTSGGFCGSCQKEVIDFSSMTQHELIQYFKTDPMNVCGRLSQSQLNTSYTLSAERRQTSRFRWLGTGLIGVSIVSLLSSGQAQAQQKTKDNQEVQLSVSPTKSKPKNDKDRLVKGIVVEEDMPIPGVNVILKGTDVRTVTDFDGKFEFPQLLKAGDVLVFHFIGYESKEVKIKNSKGQEIYLQLEVDMEVMWMGEIDVQKVYTSKPTFWQKIKAIFK